MLGERLAELRNDRNLTQKEFGKLFGISRNTIHNYERGHTEPPHKVLVRFAQYFGVSTDYLMGITREPTPVPVAAFILDKQNNQIQFTRPLNNESWNHIEKYLRFLLSEDE